MSTIFSSNISNLKY